MDPARLIQLSSAVKTLAEQLLLLRQSKAELLDALRETDEVTEEVGCMLAEGRQMLAVASNIAKLN